MRFEKDDGNFATALRTVIVEQDDIERCAADAIAMESDVNDGELHGGFPSG
jgi:hypothetical protein